MEERAKGVYLMVYLWGGVFLVSLLLLVVRIRIKRAGPRGN